MVVYHGKTIGKWWFTVVLWWFFVGFYGIYLLVMTNIANWNIARIWQMPGRFSIGKPIWVWNDGFIG